MRKFAGIVEATTAPPINCLWLNGGELKANINGEWINIATQGGNEVSGKTVLLDLSEEQSNSLLSGQQITVENDNFIEGADNIILRAFNGTFYILNKISGFGTTYVYRGDIADLAPFNNNVTYSTKIMHIDGFLNITSGTLTFKLIDTDVPEDIIGLQIGNSESVKSTNLAILNKFNLPYFFTQVDYGYGVGTFNSSQGGFIHIINAYGYDIFYQIDIDGTISKKEDYIKPNEPYSVQLNASHIGEVLDNITASKIVKCGELIVTGTTGPITYTRCSDSTSSYISFADITKQGKLSVLTYNASTKIISSNTINLHIPEASTTIIGGVKKATAIEDLVVNSANPEIIAGKINDLLGALRESGIMAS